VFDIFVYICIVLSRHLINIAIMAVHNILKSVTYVDWPNLIPKTKIDFL